MIKLIALPTIFKKMYYCNTTESLKQQLLRKKAALNIKIKVFRRQTDLANNAIYQKVTS